MSIRQAKTFDVHKDSNSICNKFIIFYGNKMNLTVREKEIKWQKTNILKGKEDEMVPKYKLELYLKARCRGL